MAILKPIQAYTHCAGMRPILFEKAWVFVQMPPTYVQNESDKQYRGFIDIVQPIIKEKILGWDNTSFNIAVRGK